MLFGACWTPRSSKTATLPRRADAPRGARGSAPRRRRSARRSRRSAPRRSAASTGSAPFTCSARNSSSTRPSWTSIAASAARHHASAARPHPQVEVGELRGVGHDRVDDDHRALRVLRDLAQHDPGAREALRHPRVLADEDRRPRRARTRRGCGRRELRVDPGLAGLLLRQRVRAVPRAERLEERAAVGAAEVVSLAAAAVVEDRLAAVLVADAREPGGDLGDRRVPVDLLERAVGAPAQRRRQPVRAVLVVVEAHRLVAGVALRAGCALSPRILARCGPRPAPRSRSCTRRGCRRSAATRSGGLLSDFAWMSAAQLPAHGVEGPDPGALVRARARPRSRRGEARARGRASCRPGGDELPSSRPVQRTNASPASCWSLVLAAVLDRDGHDRAAGAHVASDELSR